MSRQLPRNEYTVGWVCALPVEFAAAQEMLDEEHADLQHEPDDNDENTYALGSIGGHNVAIVCLPAGRTGNNPAAAVAMQMRATFKGHRFGLRYHYGTKRFDLATDWKLAVSVNFEGYHFKFLHAKTLAPMLTNHSIYDFFGPHALWVFPFSNEDV